MSTGDNHPPYAGMDVEALRALTAALNSVTTNMAEDRRLLNDIHMRVIRIESNRLDAQVARIDAKVEAQQKEIEALKLANAKSDSSQSTAIGIAGWFARHAPWIFALVVAGLLGLGIGDKGVQ